MKAKSQRTSIVFLNNCLTALDGYGTQRQVNERNRDFSPSSGDGFGLPTILRVFPMEEIARWPTPFRVRAMVGSG